MRLWTLHPSYLDAQALVAVWRRALLARQVLRGKTKAYSTHPQLIRFREHPSPVSAINAYLRAIHAEAVARGYHFEKSKLGPVRNKASIRATDGQLNHEWTRLQAILKERNPDAVSRRPKRLRAHPLFRVTKGPAEEWEGSNS